MPSLPTPTEKDPLAELRNKTQDLDLGKGKLSPHIFQVLTLVTEGIGNLLANLANFSPEADSIETDSEEETLKQMHKNNKKPKPSSGKARTATGSDVSDHSESDDAGVTVSKPAGKLHKFETDQSGSGEDNWDFAFENSGTRSPLEFHDFL